MVEKSIFVEVDLRDLRVWSGRPELTPLASAFVAVSFSSFGGSFC